MRNICLRNVITVSVFSTLLALGGILHAQNKEKSELPEKKEQVREKRQPQTRNQPQTPSKPRPPAGEPVTFLGVAAAPVGEDVRAQIDLPLGTGVGVGGLLPDSPAEKAGVRRFDILTKLDDQILISGEQLQTLVRMKKPGDEVTLTLLRAAKERTVKVNLGSHRFPATAPPRRDGWAPGYPGPGPGGPRPWEDQWKDLGEQWEKGMEEWLGRHGKDWEEKVRKFLEENFGDPETWEPKMKKWLDDEVRPQFETHVRKFANVHATIVDENGKVEITMKAGRKHVTATDPEGKIVFEGFCETGAERKKVPKDILKKVDSVKVDVKFDGLEELKKSPPAPKKPSPKKSGGKKDDAV